LPFPPPGDFPNPGIKPPSPALAGTFFTTEPPRKPTEFGYEHVKIEINLRYPKGDFKNVAVMSLVGYSLWGCKRVGHDLTTKQTTAN